MPSDSWRFTHQLSCIAPSMMHLTQCYFIAVFSAFLAWILIYILLPILRRRLLDQPNARSSHLLPIPRGGGLVFVLVASVASALALFLRSTTASSSLPLVVAPLLALPLALVGFLDDLHNLYASWRFGVQLATGIVVTLMSPLFTPSLGLFPFLALVIAVSAIINFTNFMDGLDGLVAGCMAVVLIAAAIKLSAPWPIWSLVGALIGLLFLNWSPAKIFMGDVGSTFLGAVFAVLVLQAVSWPEASGLLLVATPLLGDSFLCVPRRLLAGQRVFDAHRLHLFQRLHQAGWPHARVSSLYFAGTAVLAVALLAGGWPWVLGLAVVELLVGFWLDRHVAVPFTVASQL